MEWVKCWISDARNFNVIMIVWFQTTSWFQNYVVMAKEIDKEFLILALSKVLSRGGGRAASHSSNFGEHWYLQLFLWRWNVFCVKWKFLISFKQILNLILNTPYNANICILCYRDACLSCEDGGVNICGLGDHLSGLGVRPQCSLHICSVSLPCFLKSGSYLWNICKLQKHTCKK